MSLERFYTTMPLALLHSLLLQQSYYGNHAFLEHHHWTLTDLAMATDIFKKLILTTDDPDGVTNMIAHVYADHCVDTNDATLVHAIVTEIAKFAAYGKEESKRNSYIGAATLLQKLTEASEETLNLKRALDSIEDISARTFYVPEEAETHLMAQNSRIFSKDLVQATGAPELLLKVSTKRPRFARFAMESVMTKLIAVVQSLPALPDTSRDQIYPMDVFLHYEVSGFKKLIQTIQSDLTLLLKRARGEISLSLPLQEVLDAVMNNQVPTAWTAFTFPSCPDLKEWMAELQERMKLVTSYVSSQPECYVLGAFLRPDRFFDAVLQMYARQHFKDVSNIEMDYQIMPNNFNPTMSPQKGVFVMGLQLYNASWDTQRSVLIEPAPGAQESQLMPIIWLQPSEVSPDKNTVKYQVYSCPVFTTDNPELHWDKNTVYKIPLPTIDNQNLWIHRRVFLNSTVHKTLKATRRS